MSKSTIKQRLAAVLGQLDDALKFADEAPATEGNSPAIEGAKEYTLADGNKIYITELKDGGIATSKDADGKDVPCAAGDYSLVDGTVITVGEAGAISAVKAPEAAVETPEQAMQKMREIMQQFDAPGATPEANQSGLVTCVKALMNYAFGWDMRRQAEEQEKQAALTAYQTMSAQSGEKHLAEIATLKQAFTAQIKEQSKAITELANIITELTESGNEAPIQEPKNKFRAESNENKKGTLSRRMAAASAPETE